MNSQLQVAEFIQRGGKIEFIQKDCGFLLTFPSGYKYLAMDCMRIDDALLSCETYLLTEKYDKLFKDKP